MVSLQSQFVNRHVVSALKKKALQIAGGVAMLFPLALAGLINPTNPSNRVEFLAALIIYAIPTIWAFYLARRFNHALISEDHLLRQIEIKGQTLQTDLAAQSKTIALDGTTWEQFNPGIVYERNVMPVSVRMVQNICHEAASGRFPPVSTIVQIYALEFRDGVRRLRVPQTLALRFGILGTFVGLLLALSHLANIMKQPGTDVIAPLVQSMMVAFGTSVAGLMAAILIQIVAEIMLLRQQELTRQIEDTVGCVATTLAMTLSSSPFMRHLDEFGNQLSKHSTGLADHAHEIREATQTASKAIEERSSILKESASSLLQSQETFITSIGGLNTALSRVHGSLDALASLDERLGKQMQAVVSEVEQTCNRSNQASVEVIVNSLTPVLSSLAASVDKSKESAELIAGTLSNLERAVQNLSSHNRPREQRLVVGLVIVMMTINVAIMSWFAMKFF